MAKLFSLQNNQVIYEPEVLNIPQFKLIWDRDSTKEKNKAKAELSYIFYTKDYLSPYIELEDPEYQIKKDFFNDSKWNPDKEVIEAQKHYELLQETQSVRLLEGARIAANKLSNFFRSLDFDERDEKGKAVYSANEVTNSLKNIGGVLDSINKLVEQVKREKSITTKVRGGGKIGRREE